MQSVDKNILSHVSLCESQPSNSAIVDKKYVQDGLRERGQQVGSFSLFFMHLLNCDLQNFLHFNKSLASFSYFQLFRNTSPMYFDFSILDTLLRKNEDENHPAIVFVCGSSKQILKDVADVFLHIFSEFLSNYFPDYFIEQMVTYCNLLIH